MSYVDFKALKASVSMEQVAQWLGLFNELKQRGQELRGPCPRHPTRGDRMMVVNLEKGVWNSFCGCGGGDIISLTAKTQGLSLKDAAQVLAEQFQGNSVPEARKGSKPQGKVPLRRNSSQEDQEAQPEALEPLKGLDPEHEVIELLGLSRAVCEAVGIGYCKKGLMAARIVFPIRLPQGELLGYVGLATKPDQQPLLKFPSNLDERIAAAAEPAQATPPSDMRGLLRVVK